MAVELQEPETACHTPLWTGLFGESMELNLKAGDERLNQLDRYFDKTGAEVYTFRVTMARNEKGELMDFYNAEAKISYVGTAISPPPIELKNISDRQLVVSYDKLGFITVDYHCRRH